MTSIGLIFGGLGIFLYGMRIMSTGLQQAAGERMRGILATVTRNRWSGIFAGLAVTSVIQSSSATTVMIVSFANAGLLTLTQAIGPVMGANIGTTVTGWLVSLLGFKVQIDVFALPTIGLGVLLSFLNSNRLRQLGQVFIGFGLLFLGLMFLKDGVPDLRGDPSRLAFLQQWAQHGFASVLLFVAVGTVITIIIQSSSATMAVTLTMAASGWISYPVAAALVLGENIGTTITAILASIGANNTAKRVARVHTAFNLIGVLWMVPVLGLVLRGIDLVLPGDATRDPLAVTTHIAAFHTFFNVANTFVLVGFVPQLRKLAEWLVPVRGEEVEGGHLRFLSVSGLLSTPEFALLEVRRALQGMVGVVQSMFRELEQVVTHPEAKLGKVVDGIKRGEQKTDEMETEIAAFCANLAAAGGSSELGGSVTSVIETASEAERMGDHCMNLVLLAQRRYDKGYRFGEQARKDLDETMLLVEELLALAHVALDAGELSVTRKAELQGEARLVEEKIDALRDRARKRHAEAMQAGTFPVREGLIFLDMMNNLEKIGDYCFSIVRRVTFGKAHESAA